MICYWFNRQELLEKNEIDIKIIGVKKKLLNIIMKIKKDLKENANNNYRSLSEDLFHIFRF